MALDYWRVYTDRPDISSVMSSHQDSRDEKDKVQDSRQEKGSLQDTDAHEARTADKTTIREIEQQNKNRWESEQGIFAIVDDEVVLAS